MTVVLLLSFLAVIGLCISVWMLLVLFYTRVPFVKTPEKKIPALLSELSLSSEQTVYDLGCGDAHILLAIEKSTGATTIGYELSPIAYAKARWNVWRAQAHTKVMFGDFHRAPLQDADVVFIFLIVGVMKQTWSFLTQTCRPGTVIISYGFVFPDVKPDKVVHTPDAPHGSAFIFYTIP